MELVRNERRRKWGRYLAPPKFSTMVDLTVSTIAAILGALVCRLLECDELNFLELNEVKDMMSLEEHCLWRNLSRGVGLLSLSVIILQADDVTSSNKKLRVLTGKEKEIRRLQALGLSSLNYLVRDGDSDILVRAYFVIYVDDPLRLTGEVIEAADGTCCTTLQALVTVPTRPSPIC